MQKIQGVPLYQVADRLSAMHAGGQITMAERLAVVQSLGKQMMTSVRALEKAGVVHRDLSGGNIMVSSNGTVKVIDFGAAKVPGTTDRMLLDAYTYGGTPGFRSANVSRAYDAVRRPDGSFHTSTSKDDVFSMGRAMLMLTSRTAFQAVRQDGGHFFDALPQALRHDVGQSGLDHLLRATTTGGGKHDSAIGAKQALDHAFFKTPIAGASPDRVANILPSVTAP
jgi:serine/threonine protein kinase